MAGNLTAMIAAAFSGGAAPPVTTDPYFDYTTLLLPGNGTNGAQNNTFLDGSTNNFTITRNGNTTQGTFSPFSQTGWGNYFDGSVDSLSVASNAAFAYGTSDFTWEVWVFPTASTWTSGSGNFYIIDHGSSNGTLFYYQNRIAYYNPTTGTGSALYTGGGTVTPNQWSHIAVSRQSGTTRIYVNGQLSTSGSDSNNYAAQAVTIGRAGSGAQEYVGYMSNVRIVKGTAVYTSNFTPPTSPLTAISGTSLLTCQSNRFIDNSSNNFTITVNGNTSVVAFSPFNPSASWSAATYGGSGYFDGSGDYLTAPDNAAFQFGSGDFTVEFWVYPQASPSGWLIAKGDAASVTGSEISWTAAGTYDFYYGGSYLQLTSPTLTVGSWQHIAVVRNGTTITIYKNGVSSTSGSIGTSSLNTGGSNPFSIGQYAGGAFNGYFSSLRVVKGTAVYTGNFTPPTAPLTAITNTSLLLNFTNAGIYDATSKNDLETVGNAQISTTQSKWGGSSIYLDGTGDYLDLSPSGFSSFGTGNFTVEFWMRTAGSTFNIINPATATGTGYWALLVVKGSGGFRWNDAYNISNLWTQTATSVLDNNWHHIAVVRNGTGSGNVNIYFDGVVQGTAKTDSTNYNGASTAWRIGSGNVGSLNGYIQDLRITPGIARYTANFTAPTAAFPTL